MNSDKKKNKKPAGKVLRFERDSGFFAKRADNKRMQNDPVNAAMLYWAALKKDPNDHEVRLALADVLTDMHRFIDSNHVIIPHMHESEYFMTEAYYRAGYNYFGMGLYDAAHRCFDRFFELTDEVSERTDAVMDMFDFIEGLEQEEPLLAAADDVSFNNKLDAARRHMMNSEYDKAMERFSELHEIKPNDRRIRYDLALSCMCCHEFKNGLEYIDKMLDDDPDDLSALSLKLVYAQNVHDEVMMGGICNRLESSEPELPEELLPIIGVILDAGRTELALSLAKRVYNNSPYSPLANHVLALCWIKQKKSSIAAGIYDRLLKIDPNDSIAAFYRTKCADETTKLADLKTESLVHYQLPLTDMMENIKVLASLNIDDAEALKNLWMSDDQLKWLLRWALTLKEFGISYAVMNILRVIGDSDAQYLMRESIVDPDANPTLVHETLGMLKALNAQEPYFAVLNNTLLEGRVNMLDMSEIHMPKQYMLIYPRFHSIAGGIYDIEVYAAASGIMEGFLAGLGGEFPKITEAQSVALSAALECAACKKCGVMIKDDILDRYGITDRRLKNAFDRLMSAVFADLLDDDTEDDI